jgi:hypothetical protein
MKPNNIFNLIGDVETALTKALGFMLDHNRRLLKKLLQLVGINGVNLASSLQKTKIEIEVPDRHGRTDIEIKSEGYFHLIIEAKVGGNIPSEEQLERYSQKLEKSRGRRKLIVITEVDVRDRMTTEILENRKLTGLNENITFLTWDELHESLFTQLDLNDEFDRQFEEYLEKTFMQNEIIVASADPNPEYGKEDLDFFRSRHLYWYSVRTLKKRHNYLALYLPAQFGKDQGISEIARIIRYELCSLAQLGIPESSNYYNRLSRGDKGEPRYYKLVLSKPIRLPRKIKKSRGKRVRNWTTTFEKLLKAEYADELL